VKSFANVDFGHTGDSGSTRDITKLEDVIINLNGDMEKLMVVVKMWGSDMTLFRQVAERVALMERLTAEFELVDVIEGVEMRKKGKLDEQALFLGSYPLGPTWVAGRYANASSCEAAARADPLPIYDPCPLHSRDMV
jgi:hypothetical protein